MKRSLAERAATPDLKSGFASPIATFPNCVCALRHEVGPTELSPPWSAEPDAPNASGGPEEAAPPAPEPLPPVPDSFGIEPASPELSRHTNPVDDFTATHDCAPRH